MKREKNQSSNGTMVELNAAELAAIDGGRSLNLHAEYGEVTIMVDGMPISMSAWGAAALIASTTGGVIQHTF